MVMIAVGVATAFMASITLFMLDDVLVFHDTAQDVSFLDQFRWEMLGWAGVIAFGTMCATFVAWFLTRMNAKPSRTRGAATPFVAICVLVVSLYILVLLFEISSARRVYLDPEGIVVGLVASILFLCVILGPIVAPIGFFIGRYAAREHRAARAPEAFAKLFE